MKLFRKTLELNVSPITYIVFISMFVRGIFFAFEDDAILTLPFAAALAVGAGLTLYGMAKEIKRLVSIGAMTTFVVETYAIAAYLLERDFMDAFTIALAFVLASAYVYWTNAIDRLWGYTPK